MFDVYGKKVNTSCSLPRVLDRYCGQANTSIDSHYVSKPCLPALWGKIDHIPEEGNFIALSVQQQ